jgi:hypothetical protein
MPSPVKINPDNVVNHGRKDLFILNEYLIYLYSLIGVRGEDDKQTADAIKVVDCFRFIKTNEAFFRYAFLNPQDTKIYTFYPRDYESQVLRDFNNTSFHLFAKPNETLEEAVTNLNALTKSFEDAILTAREKNKLAEFTNKLLFNEEVGCLEARITPALIYIRDLNQPLPIFEEHFQKVSKSFTDSSLTNYRLVHKYFFEKYANQKFFYQGLHDIHVTRQFLDEQMQLLSQTLTPDEKAELDNEEKTQVVTYASLNELISNHNALVKNISASLDPGSDYTASINFVMTQLADPAHQRPYKRLLSETDRRNFHDPRTGQVRLREVNTVRGLNKPAGWQFTKKEATSLLPPDGRLHFHKVNDPIILIFDVNDCWLKNGKYIFEQNANTNQRWWLTPGSPYFKRATTLEKLREQQRQNIRNNNIPLNNEILAGLTRKLCGLGIPNDPESLTLENRLNLLRVKFQIQEVLNLDLPMKFIGPKSIQQSYNKKQQLVDILDAEKKPAGSKCARLLENIFLTKDMLHDYKINLWKICDVKYFTNEFDRYINIMIALPHHVVDPVFDNPQFRILIKTLTQRMKDLLLRYTIDMRSSKRIDLLLSEGASLTISTIGTSNNNYLVYIADWCPGLAEILVKYKLSAKCINYAIDNYSRPEIFSLSTRTRYHKLLAAFLSNPVLVTSEAIPSLRRAMLRALAAGDDKYISIIGSVDFSIFFEDDYAPHSTSSLAVAINKIDNEQMEKALIHSGISLNNLMTIAANSLNQSLVKSILQSNQGITRAALSNALMRFKRAEQSMENLLIIGYLTTRLVELLVTELKAYHHERSKELDYTQQHKWYFKQYNSCWGRLFGHSGIDKLSACQKLIDALISDTNVSMLPQEINALRGGRLSKIIEKYSSVTHLEKLAHDASAQVRAKVG